MLRVLFFPFRLVWDLVGVLFFAVGKLVSLILGLTFMVVGIVLTASLVGIAVGIPLMVFGFLMVLRSIF